MAVQPIPDGYHTVTPYLTVPGADRLMTFLKGAFGAEEVFSMQRPDGALGHAEIRIGNSIVMLSEPTAECTPMPATLYLYVSDVDATYRRALEAGGTSVIEPADQFWGDRTGAVKDASGNCWWIATHVEDVSPGELERRAAECFAQPPAGG